MADQIQDCNIGLGSYRVPNDKFQVKPISMLALDFPCCVCRHGSGRDSEPPCNQCGHNLNAGSRR